MRFLFVFLSAMTLSVHGADIVSYVDDQGVTILTNLTPRSSDDEIGKSRNYIPLIDRAASQHGVDRALVQAIIKVESNYNPDAVSPKNCMGLMQLHPDTARRFGVRDVFDPAENIEGGVKYLSFLMDVFGEKLDYVLAAYNAGENAVFKYEGIPPYAETVGYVKKVKALFDNSVSAVPSANHKILRFELPDGQILFTNESHPLNGVE